MENTKEIKVNRQEFYNSLKKCQLQNAGNTLPILNNTLCHVGNGYIDITQSDIENSIKVTMEIDSSEEFLFLVPTKIITDLFSTLKDWDVNIIYDNIKNIVTVITDTGEYSMASGNVAEFINIPIESNTKSINFKCSDLITGLNKASYSISKDPIRPVMTGIYMHVDCDGAVFVSTNGNTLIKNRNNNIISREEFGVIIPKTAINKLKGIIPNDDTRCSLSYNEKHIFISILDINFITRQIEGVYPNYQAVIPVVSANKYVLNKTVLLKSLHRMSLFSNDSTKSVSLYFDKDNLMLSSKDVDYGNEATDNIKISGGNTSFVCLNSDYLINILNSLGDEIVLKTNEPNKAVLMEDEDTLCLIMPMMLS